MWIALLTKDVFKKCISGEYLDWIRVLIDLSFVLWLHSVELKHFFLKNFLKNFSKV